MAARTKQGDCLLVMPRMAASSVDAIVCDPPYGLSFMGKDWDHGVPGVHFWKEALRVAKPGVHLVAFGGSRTQHRLACAIDDAGWEIRDCLMWLYGTGWPKSLNVSKAIDEAAGVAREVVGFKASHRPNVMGLPPGGSLGGGAYTARVDTSPSTDAARQWNGWGTALKPSYEPILLCRKPLAKGLTVAANVLAYGTGAIHIDGCRSGTDTLTHRQKSMCAYHGGKWGHAPQGSRAYTGVVTQSKGRWPANLVLDEESGRAIDEQSGESKSTPSVGVVRYGRSAGIMGNVGGLRDGRPEGHSDTGGASRFFYCAKASKAERGAGNDHPTVKPISLMRWLCRLVTPPGGQILDPFMGSGSTGIAALREGFNFLGIEQDAHYCDIAKRRLDAALDVSKARASR